MNIWGKKKNGDFQAAEAAEGLEVRKNHKRDFLIFLSVFIVTTAIALGISESGGGIPGITAAAVVITGIEGAVLAPFLAKHFKITDPVAEGVAIGACSHAIGTMKALEIGKIQGAMSSISLCVCGIVTTALAVVFM